MSDNVESLILEHLSRTSRNQTGFHAEARRRGEKTKLAEAYILRALRASA